MLESQVADTTTHAAEPTRRDFLFIATGAGAAVGGALTLWPPAPLPALHPPPPAAAARVRFARHRRGGMRWRWRSAHLMALRFVPGARPGDGGGRRAGG